ncbi:exopolysaccharide biosynthesis protein [Roseococcus suduntuyensis]|uniref:Exopolysaccharide synthesis, ExoD n=1 Tax=Roseococcus suduntuyensis TaxID=455361 RepID=A0A840AEB0_9PROT|nr:exopolysaccharide biosynthesis protein [Roseococcus suduntuyensis]MBB3898886.1 hypothetical protein [Roseococcus suduntuyensis]
MAALQYERAAVPGSASVITTSSEPGAQGAPRESGPHAGPAEVTHAGPESAEAALQAEHPVPISELIGIIARDWPTERVTLGELIESLGPRGYGILIVLFALPNLLPIYIPGLSPIFGFPLMIICAQLAYGLPTPRLPAFLTRRSMKRSDLRMITSRALPWLKRVERWVRPRPSIVTSRLGDRVIGAYGVLLACIVVIPLPFTNGPPSLACLIMAMGMMEEDTFTILGGAMFGIAGIALALSIIGSVGWMLMAGFGWMFGM